MVDPIKYGQSIFNYCVEKYGTLQEIARLVVDNNLKYDDIVRQGETLTFDENIGNEDIKDFLKVNKFVPTNLVNNPFSFATFDFEDGENFIFEDGDKYIYENQ